MSSDIVTEQSKTFESGIKLDSGRILAPITLVYETYGTLNETASNAVMVEHAWTGNAHLAGRQSAEDTKPGWWDAIVGPGKLLDSGERGKLSVSVGDQVIYGKYSGSEIEIDKREVKILRESDILAKVVK
jgi:co-chaperonin GroES (HSP10)